MPTIEPVAAQLQALVAAAEDPSPIVMINLLRFRDRAEYPPGFAAEACSGREAYQRYGARVVPMVGEAGGKVLWLGAVKQIVIGPADERWDEAVLVEYPSCKAFLGMVSRPDYREAAVHRTAALADSRLIATVATAGAL